MKTKQALMILRRFVPKTKKAIAGRPVLQYGHYDAEAGFIEATDSHFAVRIAVSAIEDQAVWPELFDLKTGTDRTGNGNYPNLGRLFDGYDASMPGVQFDAKELEGFKGSVDRAFVINKSHIKLEIKEGLVHVSAFDIANGRYEDRTLYGDAKGWLTVDRPVYVNAELLLPALRSVSGPAALRMPNNPLRPMLVADEAVQALVLPVRIR